MQSSREDGETTEDNLGVQYLAKTLGAQTVAAWFHAVQCKPRSPRVTTCSPGTSGNELVDGDTPACF